MELLKNVKKFNLNPRNISLFSLLLAILTVPAYFLYDFFYKYLCGEKLYSSAFNHCSDVYQKWGLTSMVLFSSISFLLSFFLLLRDKENRRFYFKILVSITAIGALLTLLTWDNSPRGWININLGLLVLSGVPIVLIVVISVIAWSYSFKSRKLGSIFFLILFCFLGYSFDSLRSFSVRLLFGTYKESENCGGIKLYREKDHCIFLRAVKQYDTDLCDTLSIRSPDLRTDCFNFIYRNRGSNKGDTSWCKLISDPYQKSLCYD